MPLSISNFKERTLWRLLARGLTLVLATGLTVMLLAVILPKNIHSYYFGLQKKEDLLAQTPSPRLILCGGSNVAFGVDSEELSKQLGIRTINTSLHAGLGLSFMLRQIRSQVKAGDVVLVIPEYQNFTSSLWRGDGVLSEIFVEVPSSAFYWGPENILTVVETIVPAVQRRFRDGWIFRLNFEEMLRSPEIVYTSRAFNGYGDVITHLGKDRPPTTIPLMYQQKVVVYNFIGISYLREFIHACEQRGGYAYLLPPCIRREDFEASQRVFNRIYEEITRAFPRNTLSLPSEFVLETDRHFYDTAYHLNMKGREIRTGLIISSLKKTEWYKMRMSP
jgi:hypothetical protein